MTSYPWSLIVTMLLAIPLPLGAASRAAASAPAGTLMSALLALLAGTLAGIVAGFPFVLGSLFPWRPGGNSRFDHVMLALLVSLPVVYVTTAVGLVLGAFVAVSQWVGAH